MEYVYGEYQVMALVQVLFLDDFAANRFQLPGAGAGTAEQLLASGNYRIITEFTTPSTGLAAAELVETLSAGDSPEVVEARNHIMPGLNRGLRLGDLVVIDSVEAWVLLQSGWQRVNL